MKSQSESESYKNAGVDITAGYEAVKRMQKHIKRTMIPGVLSDIGGFGGLFMPELSGMQEPVLVSGTDGVGTKLKLSFLMDRHHTVGIDCVAMCVNDIICAGAKPLFFLDYIAVGKNMPARVEDIVSGIAEGCVQAGCALIGGETAEMPGFYPADEYDLAGFSVGIVDKSRILNAARVQPGDMIIALPSSGPHSNGYSLIRKAFDLDRRPEVLSIHYPALNTTLGNALLAPTSIYVRPLLALFETGMLKSAAHITGGGFYENIPRCLPENCKAEIVRSSVNVPLIFEMIREAGGIPERDMFNTFNMGVGMVAVVSKEDASAALAVLHENGASAYPIGQILNGEREVVCI